MSLCILCCLLLRFSFLQLDHLGLIWNQGLEDCFSHHLFHFFLVEKAMQLDCLLLKQQKDSQYLRLIHLVRKHTHIPKYMTLHRLTIFSIRILAFYSSYLQIFLQRFCLIYFSSLFLSFLQILSTRQII